MKKAISIYFIIATLSLLPFPPHAAAQTPTSQAQTGQRVEPGFEDVGIGMGQLINIKDAAAVEGDIISFNDKGYSLSQKPYDPGIVGVIVDIPALSLEDKSSKEEKYLLTTGTAVVRVSSSNGNIKTGDLITSSVAKGVGQKATQEGYILGNALEDYTGKEAGKISVSLHPSFNTSAVTLRTNLLNNFNLALSSPFQSPVNSLRYFLAGLIAIIALGAGLAFFGRVTSKGIEALGRNPLATTAIIISIIINLILALGIMSVGVAIAYFVLVL